jgi:uncharacterized membrane protein YeaQ/YmgE (transglycosylase-associated protein family)
METLLFWIIVGIIAGLLAKSVVPGEAPAGLLGDLVTGIIGAFVGGWLFKAFLGYTYGGWVGGTIVAFIGAVVFLLLLRAITGRRYSARY